jgi:hypothetical protein
MAKNRKSRFAPGSVAQHVQAEVQNLTDRFCNARFAHVVEEGCPVLGFGIEEARPDLENDSQAFLEWLLSTPPSVVRNRLAGAFPALNRYTSVIDEEG